MAPCAGKIRCVAASGGVEVETVGSGRQTGKGTRDTQFAVGAVELDRPCWNAIRFYKAIPDDHDGPIVLSEDRARLCNLIHQIINYYNFCLSTTAGVDFLFYRLGNYGSLSP